MRVMGVSYVLVVTTVRSSTTSSCVLSALTRLSVSLYFLHSLQAPTIYHLLTLHTLYLLWHLALSGRTSRLWVYVCVSAFCLWASERKRRGVSGGSSIVRELGEAQPTMHQGTNLYPIVRSGSRARTMLFSTIDLPP
jgi:hypothetical protein